MILHVFNKINTQHLINYIFTHALMRRKLQSIIINAVATEKKILWSSANGYEKQ